MPFQSYYGPMGEGLIVLKFHFYVNLVNMWWLDTH